MEVTNKQIEALRVEALLANDFKMAEICDVALDEDADHEHRSAARAECARVIGVSEGMIRQIRRGTKWRHATKA